MNPSEIAQDLNEIELNIEEARKIAKRGEQLDRLFSNKAFKELVIEGYCKENVLRLTRALASVRPDMVEEIQAQLHAVSLLQMYFETIRMQAGLALDAIEDNEAMREEILSGEGEVMDV